MPEPSATPPIVAILSPGSMGAGVALRLLRRGVTVLTSLDGRSARSVSRAHAMGLRDVPLTALTQADLLLSIVPPGVARAVGERVAEAGVFSHGGPLYVDCNAVAPETVREIGAIITGAGGRFVDAGIVGGPPQPDGSLSPVFYASGPNAADLTILNSYGIEVRVMDAPIGSASALKMCFAGISKGLTAVIAQVILQASASQVTPALRAQLTASLGTTLEWAGRQAPLLPQKSYRWVAEMQELAHFLRDIPGAQELFNGAATFYEWLAREKDNAAGPHPVLQSFFSALGDGASPSTARARTPSQE